MSEPESTPEPLETDPLYPSGPWTGFYLQRPLLKARQWMELHLRFAAGRISGSGKDGIGAFTLRGRYDLASHEVVMHKHYVGRHSVVYRGWNEGKGIWGLWTIPGMMQDGFHIWPEGMADPTTDHLEAQVETEESVPVLVGDET